MGYFLKKLDFPLTPMVIGIVLGSMAEKNYRRALMISNGRLLLFCPSETDCIIFPYSGSSHAVDANYQKQKGEKSMKVLVTSAAFGQPAMQENIKYLNSVADTVVMKPSQKPLTAKEIATCWDGVDGIIAGMEPYTKEILAQAPENLKVISRYGVGYDRIDTEAAKEKGISVCITPGANSKAVAELTMAMMLALREEL